MKTDNNFQQAYAKLKCELLEALENTKNNLAMYDSLIKGVHVFPIEFAKYIVSVSESEQEKKIADGDVLATEFTEEKLRSLLHELKNQYLTLIKELNFQLTSYDPLFSEVDVFSPIEWSLKEVPHTKMLAFFLDPSREHGLGELPISFFLAAASLSESEIEFDVGHYPQISVYKVEAEKWIRKKNKIRRVDILIEMTKPQCRILIEGKINAQQNEDQLPDYEDLLEPKKNDVLIYLTPHDEEDEELEDSWYPLDWKDVALAFCALVNYKFNLNEKEINRYNGFELLRLWTSTLLHYVCDVCVVKHNVNDNTLLNLIAYESHINKVKEIIEEYKGVQDADQQIT